MGFVLVFGVVWGVCWWGFVGLVGVLGLVWTRVVVVGLEITRVLGRNGVAIVGGVGWGNKEDHNHVRAAMVYSCRGIIPGTS